MVFECFFTGVDILRQYVYLCRKDKIPLLALKSGYVMQRSHYRDRQMCFARLLFWWGMRLPTLTFKLRLIYGHLVGGFEHVSFFPNIGNFIIPIDFHIFKRGRYTTNQSCFAAWSNLRHSTGAPSWFGSNITAWDAPGKWGIREGLWRALWLHVMYCHAIDIDQRWSKSMSSGGVRSWRVISSLNLLL